MQIPDSLPEPTAPLTDTPRRRAILKQLRSRPSVKGSLIALIVLLVVVMLAPFLAPQNPYDLAALDLLDGRLPPGSVSMGGLHYWLGTDSQGRDMLSAILYGLRISLTVGLTAVALATVIGSLVGLIAAYAGGLIDTLLMRLVDFILGFPTILVALVLLAMLGRGVDKVVIAIVVVQWAHYARIMLRHLLPNSLGPVMVFATIQIANAIVLEATLSFLGVGVPITEPSLGLLIANGFQYLLSGDYWISMFPGLALVLLILTINVIADRLRAALDPRST